MRADCFTALAWELQLLVGMDAQILTHLKVAVIAADGFEESELTVPLRSLKQAGAVVELISLKNGQIQGFRHHDKSIQVPVDRTIDRAFPTEFEALLLPGGALNADQLRADPRVLSFVREMDEEGKPIAAICHAPWVLVSAGLVRNRTLTSYHTIEDDIRNAGGEWLDKPVIRDGNWVTSRQPSDLPAFIREMIELFSRSTGSIIRIEESA